MKCIKNIFFSLCIGICGWACSDDPEFVQPSVGFKDGMKEISVRRDTSDGHTVEMDIFAPNRINKISVLNGFTYEKIEVLTDCQGLENYKLLYPIDYSSIDKDTTLIYLFKVEDQLGKSYNNAFSVRLYRKSHPEISVRNDKIVTYYDSYPFVGAVFTGFNALSAIKFYNGEEFIGAVDVSVLPDSSACEVNQVIPGLKMGENKIRMVVSDKINQVEEKVMVITRVEKPELRLKSMVKEYVGYWKLDYGYTYDDQGRLSKLEVKRNNTLNVTIDYRYNQQGMVDVVTTTTPLWLTVYDYIYDDSGVNLLKLTSTEQNVTTGKETKYVLVQEVTRENGRIVKYYDGTNSGWFEPSYVFLWDEYLLENYINGNITVETQKYTYLDRYPNPEYVPGLPPVLAYLYMNDSQYVPYVYNYRYYDDGELSIQNAFTLDEKGRVKVKKSMDISWGDTYAYEYTYIDE